MANEESAQADEGTNKVVPATILSGFLGSGKTTLLQHVLTSKEHKLRIAVIVNDMAELNVDAQTINRTPFTTTTTTSDDDQPSSLMDDEPAVVRTKREVIALENGCICCTLRGDLIREIHRIQELGSFDHIIIESTGIAEPQQVAESFCVDPETLALPSGGESREMVNMLNKHARLDTCVTVVDSANFPQHLCSLRRFKELFQDGVDGEEGEEGEKSIAELMVEQVEFANVVLLNKIDLVSPEQVTEAKRLITSLNPKALVVMAFHGKMNVKDVLNTGLFDMEEAKQSPGWLASLQDGIGATNGEADECGVVSFVYRTNKPFHPQRLNDNFISKILHFAGEWNGKGIQDTTEKVKRKYVEDRHGCILRSKGTMWIAGRDEHEHNWSHAGRIIAINPISPWHCTVPEEKWDYDTEQEREAILKTIEQDSEHGDRRQEIVFIGIDMKEDEIRGALNACLLTDDEMAGHVLDLPLGAYHDTLPPLPFYCYDVGAVLATVRPRQNHHFMIPTKFKLTLSNLALMPIIDEQDPPIAMVRVWLDKCSGTSQHGVLLATLCPDVCEQHSLCLPLLHSEGKNSEPSEFRLRIDAIPLKRGQKRKHDDRESDATVNESGIQLHVMGNVEPVPCNADDDDNNADDDHDDDCPDGECDMISAAAQHFSFGCFCGKEPCRKLCQLPE